MCFSGESRSDSVWFGSQDGNLIRLLQQQRGAEQTHQENTVQVKCPAHVHCVVNKYFMPNLSVIHAI